VDIREFIFHEKLRGDCYRFLSACFYAPKKELFLEEGLFENLTTAVKQICPEAAVFSEKMREAFVNYSTEELSVEYARLFVGPYELLAPSYGSVYLDNERRVMGDSTMKVIGMYQQAGLSIDDDFKEVPDHITAELEFMYYLIFKEIAAIERSEIERVEQFIKTQELFLNKFLGRWIKPFCEKIKEGTDNDFYIALADCISTFVLNSNPSGNIRELLGKRTQKVLN
jgi:TorA maturation chaperone TorD